MTAPRLLWLGSVPETFGDEPACLRGAGFDVVVARDGVLDGPSTTPGSITTALKGWAAGRPRLDPHDARAISAAFDAVVICVSDDAFLAGEALRALDARLLLRAHGRRGPLRGELWDIGAETLLSRHPTLRYLPQMAALRDNDHLTGVATEVVPAWLDDAVAQMVGTWSAAAHGQGPLVVSAPAPSCIGEADIALRRLAEDIAAQEGFAVDAHLGASRLAAFATLAARLGAMNRAPGLLYPLTDPLRLHAAPFEMMMLGGPVVYFAGSALARAMPAGAPGEAHSFDEALALCRRLAAGDAALADAIIGAQRPMARAVHPRHARAAFDTAFRRLLSVPAPEAVAVRAGEPLAMLHARRLMRLLAQDAAGHGSPPNMSHEDVVTCCYHLVLDRDPDPQGFAHHVAALEAGGSPAQMLAAFLQSAEARQTGPGRPFRQWLDA